MTPPRAGVFSSAPPITAAALIRKEARRALREADGEIGAKCAMLCALADRLNEIADRLEKKKA